MVLLFMQGFELTKAELLQVMNLRPASLVEIHLIVEDCEDRLDEGRIQQLLQLIAKHLS